MACVSVASAINIQDPGTPGYVTGGSVFTGVTRISFLRGGSSYMCTGSLFADDLILTAGHCVSGANNWTVHFQTGSGDTSVSTVAAYLHPSYAPRGGSLSHLTQYDVAVLRLSTMAPAAAARYGLLMTLAGLTTATPIDIVGYGVSGGAGQTATSLFNVRHAAYNTIDGIYSGFNTPDGVVPAPDLPLGMSVVYGPSTPGGEGLINSGDSGGPALYNNKILGVASAGNGPASGTTVQNGVYYSTLHANLAEYNTGTWVNSFLVPEPGTYLLCGAGLLAIGFFRRRTGS